MSTAELEYKQVFQAEKAGEHLKALSGYSAIIKKYPQYRKAYVSLGSLYSRIGKLEDAMICYKKASNIHEDYLTWFNIGSLYYRKAKYKQAVINMEKSKKLNSSFILSVLVSGLSFSKLDNYKAAETSFKEVLIKDPENKVALNALSLLYYDNRQFDLSLKMCDELSSRGNENTNTIKLKSKIFYEKGDMEKAADLIKDLKEQDCGFTDYNSFIDKIPVNVYEDRYGTIESKIETLKEKIHEDSSPENYFTLSLCHLFKGDTDSAIETLFHAKN